MNDQLTLITVLLVLLIVAELVALYTNGIIVARNYKIMKKENDDLQRANKLISIKYNDLTKLVMDGDKVTGYMVDARGVTYIRPDDYKYLTRVEDEKEEG